MISEKLVIILSKWISHRSIMESFCYMSSAFKWSIKEAAYLWHPPIVALIRVLMWITRWKMWRHCATMRKLLPVRTVVMISLQCHSPEVLSIMIVSFAVIVVPNFHYRHSWNSLNIRYVLLGHIPHRSSSIGVVW